MASFKVNGEEVSSSGKSLLRFLREDLGLTGTKDGCEQGGCGACMVLVDGKPVKSCLLDTSRLDGKSVETIEGLSPWEKEVFSFAFAEAGAVQCGFCSPGFVISAKALLRSDPSPDEKAIRHALRHNYCRCTGYVKVVEAVRLASMIFREGAIPEKASPKGRIGERAQRVDALEKVLGTGLYADDIRIDGMLYGVALRTAYARARVLSVDTSKAKELPGVEAVLTAEDIPGENITGYVVRDQYTLVPPGSVTHYLGDPIAIVAAKDRETAEKARELIEVRYEVLSPLRSPEEALRNEKQVFEGREDNVLRHVRLASGDAEGALARSEHIVSRHFSTPATEHAYLERECSVAYMEEDGTVFVYSACQSPFKTREMLSRILATDKVKVENPLIGGAFGGKFDLTVQHHAALLALKTGKPVKFKLTRSESILVHPKRHPFEMDFTLGAGNDGIIQALKGRVVIDTGGYASFGMSTIEKACLFSTGPYVFKDYDIEGISCYTDNPPGGAQRGFAILETCFAVESLINILAEELGISPLELRMRNAVRPGLELPNGQVAGSYTGFAETLEAVRPYIEEAEREGKPWGMASGIKNISSGCGLKDYGRVRLVVDGDGVVHIHSGATGIGQGISTVLVQVIADVTGLPFSSIAMEPVRTWIVPDTGASGGSRQTLITGEACRRAAEKLKAAMDKGERLEGREFYGEYLAATDTGKNQHIAYSYATQVCILDPATGLVDKIVAAHAIGQDINRLGVEGQIEGGVMMSAGLALTERFPLDADLRPPERFSELGLLNAERAPLVVPVIVNKPGLKVASGAVGIGEVTCVPTAPAIAEAYYQLDGKRRYSLPLEDTPYSK